MELEKLFTLDQISFIRRYKKGEKFTMQELDSIPQKFWKNEFEALFKALKEYCDQVEINFLSTPFDLESASFLNPLMDVFKISSSDITSDITNKPFIEFICEFKKPIILSTGASNLNEIQKAAKDILEDSILQLSDIVD